MKFRILYILILTNISCTNDTNSTNGMYEGYYYQTLHNLKLGPNKAYKYTTEGHFGDYQSKGQYTIYNDTIILLASDKIEFGQYYLKSTNDCLINLEMHTELCKDPEKISDDPILINYPQTKPKSEVEIKELTMMLKKSLEHPNLKEYLSNRSQILIQNYYEIPNTIEPEKLINDKSVNYVSEEETNDNTEYLLISEIRIGIETAFINIREHDKYGGNLTFFNKEEGEWFMIPRKLGYE